MKKTTIIILTFIFLISLTIIPGYKQESIMTSKKEVKSAIAKNEIYYDIKFNKKNELGEPLSDIIFKVKDINNYREQIIPEYITKGNYYLSKSISYTYEEFIEMLISKEEINQLKTVEDAYNLTNYVVDCSETKCEIFTVLPFILEEVKAPSGYVKEKRIIFSEIALIYNIENEKIIFDYFAGYIYTDCNVDYNKIKDFNNFSKKIINGEYDNIIECACPERRINLKSLEDRRIQFAIEDDSSIDSCVLNIINKKGNVDLSIKNYVNEKPNITTTTNKTLKYKIEIENKGTASSTENTIITEVPKGLEYVEDSASHDGEYNKEEHQVEWRIDEINAEEKVELTYEAIIPKDADSNMEYIGTTSINSKEVTEDIKSEETIVKIEKTPITNPKTSNFVNFLVLIISGIVVTGIYITTYKRRIN